MKNSSAQRRNQIQMNRSPFSSAQDLRPQARALSWMASLSVAAGEVHTAERYLLEMLAWCVLYPRHVVSIEGQVWGDADE